MPSTFAITISGTKLTGRNELSYTVTNTGDTAIRGRADLLTPAPENEKPPHLVLEGSPYRDFVPNGTQQFTIRLDPSAKPGSYTARLRMVDDEQPNDVATDGPTFTYEIEAPPPPKPFPKWIIFAVAAMLVVAAGVTATIILWPKPTVPDLTGMTLQEAQSALESAKLRLGLTDDAVSDQPVGTVILQDPESGTEATKDVAINLIFAMAPPPPDPVPVPNVMGLTEDAAKKKLVDGKLTVGTVGKVSSRNQPVGRVAYTTPGFTQPGVPGVAEGAPVNILLAQDLEPYRNGDLTLTLAPSKAFADLDTGFAQSSLDATSDIRFSAQRTIQAQNGARLVSTGGSAPLAAGCSAASISATSLSVNQLQAGTHFCVKTKENRLSDVEVIEAAGPSGSTLRLRFRTYPVPLNFTAIAITKEKFRIAKP